MKKWIILALLVGVISAFLFLFNMKPTAIPGVERIAFSREGFTDATALTDTNKLVASNEDYALYLNETNSYFKVLDKHTGHEWKSNPTVPDPWQLDPTKPMTQTAIDKQKATLEITYFNRTGSTASLNNFKLSISHPKSVLSEAGQRTYSIKYVTNGFQVLYDIKDLEIDYSYFPKYITKEHMETLEDAEYLQSIAYKNYDPATERYFIEAYEKMSKLVAERLYPIFYEKLGYTREQVYEDNLLNGITEFVEKPRFQVAIQVTLEQTGVKTAIIRDSIVEPSDVKIANIVLYPMFGTAISHQGSEETNGYLVLPDGNGALIEFNNGKHYQNPYRKRLYGQDLSLLPMSMPEEQQKINIPLYGMVKDEGGFAAIITQGDAMANIHADVSGRIDSYNKIYTSFDLRELERVVLGSGFNRYGINLWTKDIVETDFEVTYHFLRGQQNSYVGIAQVYREHLIDKGLTHRDLTPYTVLNAELVGAYDRKEFFLGVPYYTTQSVTTFKEAEIIISELLERDLTHINVTYLGVMNGGLKSSVQDRAKIERVLGGKEGYQSLSRMLNQANIKLYAKVDFVTASEYHKLFDDFRYTASRIDGSLAYAFNYHFPTRLPYAETEFIRSKDDYVVNPLYYQAIYDAFTRDFDNNFIALGYLGSTLAGHYTKQASLYKQDALRLQESVISNMTESLMLENPLAFAMPYADQIVDLPTEATLYSIIDDQIPLLQLILSGLIDYSSQSLNMANTRSVEYNFLKVLETGSNVKYTLTYDDSRELLNTEYNYFMSTQYQNWLNVIENQVKEMDQLGIHQGYLINHERMASNVYRVTYSHGLVLMINYNLSPVTVNATTIPALDYVVIGG